jgi:putative oxidoreductase
MGAMKDIGLFALRATAGSLLAGHGLQKLAGAFGGNGLEATGQWFESLGLKPGRYWALAAGLAETSGVLMALGLFEPLGEIGVISAMAMATAKVHWGKPIWNAAGGPELPVLNMAIATALIFTGPGAISLDTLFGTRMPKPLAAAAAAAAAGLLVYGITQQSQAQQEAESAQPATDGSAETAAN